MRERRVRRGRPVVDGEDAAEVLVLLSGGIDSAACVAFYLEIGRPLCAMFVDYRQPARREEGAAAQAIADHYGITLAKSTWAGRTQKTAGLTPGRNALLLSAALMERPPGVTGVALGIHSGTNYQDCTPSFVRGMQEVFKVDSGGRVSIATPFLEWTKGDIIAYSRSSGVPINLTYSCERGGPQPCGRCLSCRDREVIDARTYT